MHIFWARLASFGHLGLISDPLIVSKFYNETHDPKGQENKIYTKVKSRETFYCHKSPNSSDCLMNLDLVSQSLTCNELTFTVHEVIDFERKFSWNVPPFQIITLQYGLDFLFGP